MKTYLVGGAVRDYVLGVPNADRDYVVTGATHADMLYMGFEKVGAEFPVYLCQGGEEYALARREKKNGNGYHGFDVDFGPEVTLAEDLSRRDFTINSMAMDPNDNFDVVDPFNGMVDLKNKVLRHTSNAFQEDPVRVLRMARFMARFGPEWVVAPETMTLAAVMSKRGDLDHLTAERVWKELSRALMEKHPRLFFDTLLKADCLHKLFPEVYALVSALEAHRWHPEGNAYEHTMLVLNQAVVNGYDLETRLACLCHDFGKGLTKKENFPAHYGHDVNGVPVTQNFCDRLTVPSKMRDRAMKATRYHMYAHQFENMKSNTFVKMFDDMRALNDPDSVRVLYEVMRCDTRGRLYSEDADVSHVEVLLNAFDAYRSVKFNDVFPNGETNVNAIKDKMMKARAAAVAAAR